MYTYREVYQVYFLIKLNLAFDNVKLELMWILLSDLLVDENNK